MSRFDVKGGRLSVTETYLKNNRSGPIKQFLPTMNQYNKMDKDDRRTVQNLVRNLKAADKYGNQHGYTASYYEKQGRIAQKTLIFAKDYNNKIKKTIVIGKDEDKHNIYDQIMTKRAMQKYEKANNYMDNLQAMSQVMAEERASKLIDMTKDTRYEDYGRILFGKKGEDKELKLSKQVLQAPDAVSNFVSENYYYKEDHGKIVVLARTADTGNHFVGIADSLTIAKQIVKRLDKKLEKFNYKASVEDLISELRKDRGISDDN